MEMNQRNLRATQFNGNQMKRFRCFSLVASVAVDSWRCVESVTLLPSFFAPSSFTFPVSSHIRPWPLFSTSFRKFRIWPGRWHPVYCGPPFQLIYYKKANLCTRTYDLRAAWNQPRSTAVVFKRRVRCVLCAPVLENWMLGSLGATTGNPSPQKQEFEP